MTLELLRNLGGQPNANIIQIVDIHLPSVANPSALRKTGYGEELPFLQIPITPICAWRQNRAGESVKLKLVKTAN
jgi:hypothetical protein